MPKASRDGDAVAIAVALADKLDTLVGFWAIGEKPTGSGDPYQLRRAALGVIRIVLENDLRLPLVRKLAEAYFLHASRESRHKAESIGQQVEQMFRELGLQGRYCYSRVLDDAIEQRGWLKFAQRFRSTSPPRPARLLRRPAEGVPADKGARHNLIDAVFSLGGQDDLALIVKRVEALTEFLKTDDGANLLDRRKRAPEHPRHRGEEGQDEPRRRRRRRLLREPEEQALPPPSRR